MFSVIWPQNCLAYVPNLLVSFYLVKNLFWFIVIFFCVFAISLHGVTHSQSHTELSV